jgi:hypothetical protein
VKVVAIRHTHDPRKALKGFADIRLDNGVEIRDFRISQEPGKRVRVFYPQTVLMNPETGQKMFKSIINFPDELKGQLDLVVLQAWEKERTNGTSQNQLS